MIKLVLMLGIIFVAISYGHLAYADSEKTVCVYEPLDLFMDPTLTTIIANQIATHNVNVTTVRIVDQILHQGEGCSVIVKIDRAINQNYAFTDKTVKYQISGNTITIFTYRTSAVFSPSSGGGNSGGGFGQASGGATFTPMTNWNCEIQAHSSKYYSNYHISTEGYYSTLSGYCDPFKQSSSAHSGELPYNVIRHSVDTSLLAFGLT